MTKTCKKLLLVILTLCFASCLSLFVACGTTKPNNDAVTYTVTVQTDATSPASGVKVQIRKGGATFESKTTGENGKAEFELVPDSYDVALSSLPAHYSVPKNANLSLTAENRNLTVTLEKNFAYTVNLVDSQGNPYYAEGVSVGVCTLEGNCLTPVALESNGVATIEADPGNYHVKVNDLPANAKYECDAEGYYTGKNFSATDTEMTITVYNVTLVNAATPMTDAEKTAFAQNSNYTANSNTAYHFEKHLAANETAYYSITPDFDGDYLIYYKNSAASNYVFNGTTFTPANDQGDALYVFPNMQAGKTYYFNVRNVVEENVTTALDLEFVIEAPAASHTIIDIVGDVTVTIAQEGATAMIEYTPAIGAAFKLTGPADLKTSIVQLAYATDEADHSDDSFKSGAECTARFTEDKIGPSGKLYFSVAVKDVASYPVTFTVKVEKTADLKNTTTVLHTQETLTQFGNQTDKILTYVPVDGTAQVVYNETDKCYHLNDANGPVVVVKLTKSIDDFDRYAVEGALVYLDEATNGMVNPYIVDTTVDKTSLTAGNTYDDYRLMLRGFANYNYEPNNQGGQTWVKPTNITEQSYYAKFVNDDGVYPLTKELEAFLKTMAENYAYDMPLDADEDYAWLFACYYYKDAIEGVYNDADDPSYTLTVNSDGTYILTTINMFTQETEIVEEGTWLNNGNNYTLSVTDTEVSYTATLDAQGTLTCVDNDSEDMVFTYVPQAEEPNLLATYVDLWNDLKLYLYDDNTFEAVARNFMSGEYSDVLLAGTYTQEGSAVTLTVVTDNTYADSVNVVYNFAFDKYVVTVTFGSGEYATVTTYTFTLEQTPVETRNLANAKLELYADNTFVLYTRTPGGFNPTLGGSYTVEDDGTYTFTISIDETGAESVSVTYNATTNTYVVTVTVDAEHVDTYTFTPDTIESNG